VEIREENHKINSELLLASNPVAHQPQASESHLVLQLQAQLSRLRGEVESKDKRIRELDNSLLEAFKREESLKDKNALIEETLITLQRNQQATESSRNKFMTSSMIEDSTKNAKDQRLVDLEKINRSLEADKNLLILELDARQAQVNEARDHLQRSKELTSKLQKEKNSLKENLRDNEKSLIEFRLQIESLQVAAKETEARTLEHSHKQSTNLESNNGADGSAKEVSRSVGNQSIKDNTSGERHLGNQALSKDSRDSFDRVPKDFDEFRKENEELKKTIAYLQETCSDQQTRIQILKQSCIDFEKKLIIAKVAKDELENESQISNAQKKMLSYLENLLCSIFKIIDSQQDLSLIRQQVESQKLLFEEEKSRLEAVQRRKSNSSDSIFKLDADGSNLGLAV